MDSLSLKSALTMVLLVAIGVLVLADCSGMGPRRGSKQDAMTDCEASGNSAATCRKWIGE